MKIWASIWLVMLCLWTATPSLAEISRIDINQADQAQLEQLPGIGPSKAKAIIRHREAHGPFASVDALDAVPGIGPKTVANLREQASVGATPTVSGKGIPAPRPAAIITGQGKTRFFDAQGRPIRKPPTASGPAGR